MYTVFIVTSWWAENGGLPDGAQEYTDQLIWYDSINLVDDYVWGSFIFCVEIPGWSSWQLTQPVIDDLVTYMNSPNVTEVHEVVNRRIEKLYQTQLPGKNTL